MKSLITERVKLILEEKKKKDERIKFYKEFYSNLSPTGFSVSEKDGKIIIDLD